MKQNLLLLEDVYPLGKKGEIVSVKSGYARNYLLPQQKALIAHKNTIRMQERLKKEREAQAVEDKKEAEVLAKKLESVTLSIEVKVDQEGHLYGSVSANDIQELFDKEKIPMEKKFIKLSKPIKTLGMHSVNLVLKEGVEASVSLDVMAEAGSLIKKKTETPPKPEKAKEKEEEMKEFEENAEDAKES